MHQARHAFDVQAPFIVTSEELVYGTRRFRRGEAFPWKLLGVSELDLLTLWSALQVDVSPAPTALPAAPVPPGAVVPDGDLEVIPMGAVIAPGGEKRTVLLDGTPVELVAGPTINVATPDQQRRKKR